MDKSISILDKNHKQWVKTLVRRYHQFCLCWGKRKIDDFDFPDVGQIGSYIVACNHILKRPDDNPTIGLLICKKRMDYLLNILCIHIKKGL